MQKAVLRTMTLMRGCRTLEEELDENVSKYEDVIPVPQSSLSSLLEYIDFARGSRELYDLTIESRGRPFYVHKLVLAAQSSFFRNILSSGECDGIIKLDLDPKLLEHCIEYLYRGTVNVPTKLCTPLRQMCKELGISELQKYCCLYELSQRKIDVENCVEMYSMACFVNDTKTEQVAKDMILENLETIQFSQQFLDLSGDCIEGLFNHSLLGQASPAECFTAVLDWVREDIDIRGHLLQSLLACLSLEMVPMRELNHVFRSNIVLQAVRPARALVLEAINNRSLMEEVVVMIGVRKFFKPPWLPASSEVVGFSATFNSPGKLIAELPSEIHYHGYVACCVDLGSLFVSGLGEEKNEIWEFDSKTGKWKADGVMLHKRQKHCMISLHKNLYIIGGGPEYWNRRMHPRIEAKERGSSEWKSAGTLVGNCCNNTCCCTLGPSNILVFGVEDDMGYHTLQVYSTLSHSVTSCITLPDGNQWVFGVVVAQQHVIMVSRNNTYICPVESVFQGNSEAVRTRDRYRAPNMMCAVVLSSDESDIMLIGGFREGQHRAPSVYKASVGSIIYDSDSGWQALEDDLVPGRSHVTAGAVSRGLLKFKALE